MKDVNPANTIQKRGQNNGLLWTNKRRRLPIVVKKNSMKRHQSPLRINDEAEGEVCDDIYEREFHFNHVRVDNTVSSSEGIRFGLASVPANDDVSESQDSFNHVRVDNIVCSSDSDNEKDGSKTAHRKFDRASIPAHDHASSGDSTKTKKGRRSGTTSNSKVNKTWFQCCYVCGRLIKLVRNQMFLPNETHIQDTRTGRI